MLLTDVPSMVNYGAVDAWKLIYTFEKKLIADG